MGKRLQGRTKDKRKQGNFVSHVIFSLRNIFSHIPPTADVSLVSSAFVLSRVTAETQRSGEKAKQRKQSSIARGPQEQRWLHSKPLTEGKMSFCSGLFSSNTNCSVYQILDCSAFFVLLFFFLHCLLAERTQLCFCMKVSRPADVKPSVSLPQVRSNLIRMARSDMSHDGDD